MSHQSPLSFSKWVIWISSYKTNNCASLRRRLPALFWSKLRAVGRRRKREDTHTQTSLLKSPDENKATAGFRRTNFEPCVSSDSAKTLSVCGNSCWSAEVVLPSLEYRSDRTGGLGRKHQLQELQAAVAAAAAADSVRWANAADCKRSEYFPSKERER